VSLSGLGRHRQFEHLIYMLAGARPSGWRPFLFSDRYSLICIGDCMPLGHAGGALVYMLLSRASGVRSLPNSSLWKIVAFCRAILANRSIRCSIKRRWSIHIFNRHSTKY
jgi:hypothetical protein